MMVGKLRTVVLDAADISGLADFYSALAGWTRAYADDEWITMTTPDGWRIGMQYAPDHVPPQWPDPARPQQAHLDFRVPDLEAGTARALELGATLLNKNETWHTLADPAGHPFDVCLNTESPETTLMGVMLDCPDAKELSVFYSKLLGKPITYDGEGAAMIGNDGEQPVLFQQIANYAPPQWPDPAHPQQFHLDVLVDDIDTAEPAALAIGATRLAGEGGNWRVYADPANKPFCLTWIVE
jgi:catechol-2,3-dioxygenase